MENNKPYYVTYKFYDERGRRLSIFALPIALIGEFDERISPRDTYLHLYIIGCSKKDTFSKKKALGLFEEYINVRSQGYTGSMAHPIELQIPIVDNKPKTTFLRWCESNYFKYQPTVFAIEAPALWRENEMTDANFKELKILPIEIEEDDLPVSEN